VSNQGQDGHDGLISLFAGIGVGVLIGAAVALLLAPQAGDQTRAQIRDSAEDALGRLRTSMDELRTRVEELASRREGTSPGALQGGEAAGATDESTPAAS
jgi:gas vesicle protein